MPRVNYSGLFLWSRRRAFGPPVEPRRGNTAAESAAVFFWGNPRVKTLGFLFSRRWPRDLGQAGERQLHLFGPRTRQLHEHGLRPAREDAARP